MALKELETAHNIDSSNTEIKELYEKLRDDIDKQKLDEKKVFKSFFRNVNKSYVEEDNKSIVNNDSDIGKSEMKLLEMIIENCYTLINKLRRDKQFNEKECNQLENVMEKAKNYKDDLQKLLDLNFEKPNDELVSFAKENNLDLKDLNVKEEFIKLRDEYLKKIHKFYRQSLDPNNSLKKKKLNKPKKENSSQKENNQLSNKKLTLPYPTILIILILSLLTYYINYY